MIGGLGAPFAIGIDAVSFPPRARSRRGAKAGMVPSHARQKPACSVRWPEGGRLCCRLSPRIGIATLVMDFNGVLDHFHVVYGQFARIQVGSVKMFRSAAPAPWLIGPGSTYEQDPRNWTHDGR